MKCFLFLGFHMTLLSAVSACSGSGGSDSGGSGCTETTYEITNWSGSGESNTLYTGTSCELEWCTQIQSDPLTITIQCQADAYGNTDLISEGCGVLGIASPGNILTDVGASPSSGTACAGQTVSGGSVTCYQECRELLPFRITSGSCG